MGFTLTGAGYLEDEPRAQGGELNEMLTAEGWTVPPIEMPDPPANGPSLDFSVSGNSQYLALGL